MKLTPQQKQAVEHTVSPLLIVAGAGTGKTTVITERIAHLIENEDVMPESLLALTFTEKAATEMLERIDQRLAIGHGEPCIRTFHGFCDQVLRDYGLEIGLNTGYRILTEVEAWMYFKEHLFDFPLEYFRPVGNPIKSVSAMIQYFGRLQDEYVDPDTYSRFAESLPESSEADKMECRKHRELANVYRVYLELKYREGMFEFSDLHYHTLKLFDQRPNVLHRLQQSFASILVDEFQDTNLIQFELIKALCPDGRNLTVVADDDQSIYAFRGSNITNILQFSSCYPDAAKISLTHNYRSPQKLLDRTYMLIQNNNPERLEVKEKIEKKLTSTSSHYTDISHRHFNEGHEEVAFICDTILQLKETESLQFSDFAILVRANSHADPFLEELHFRGIPFQFPGLKGLYEREEVKYLLSFLRFLRNPRDSVSLFHILRLPYFGLEMEALLEIMRQHQLRKVSLWSIFKKLDAKNIAQSVAVLSEYIESSREMSGGQIVWDFLQKCYLPTLLHEESIENQKKILNITRFFDRIKDFEERANLRDAVALINFLDLMIEAGENPATAEGELDYDAVRVMTVHASKGLEFEVVFVPSLVSQRFPSQNRSHDIPFPDGLKKEVASGKKSNMPEERRLFYVACTRARKHLFLTSSSYYDNGKNLRKVSPFVEELGFVIEKPEKKKRESVSRSKSGSTVPAALMQSSGGTHSFSYSQISDFRECPRKYQYRYIFRLPDEAAPAMSLGNTLHITLKKFYDRLKLRQAPELFETRQEDLLDMLLALYRESFDTHGYINKQHQHEAFERGKAMLVDFYHQNGPEFTVPWFQEKKFVLPIENILLTGKFDRIDRIPGSVDEVEIVDYKSGKIKDQKDTDKDLQLSLYALACRDALRLKPRKLTLYFLDGGKKIVTSRTDEQLDTVRQEFLATAREMLVSDFVPKPNIRTCAYCPYRNVCDKAVLA